VASIISLFANIKYFLDLIILYKMLNKLSFEELYTTFGNYYSQKKMKDIFDLYSDFSRNRDMEYFQGISCALAWINLLKYVEYIDNIFVFTRVLSK